MKEWVLFIPLWISLNVHAFAEGNALEEAKRLGNDYIAYSTSAMPKYFMIADILARSSPDSPLQFNSKGEMKLLRNDDGSYEESSWYPTIHSDHRLSKPLDLFASIVSLKLIRIGNLSAIERPDGDLALLDEKYFRENFVHPGGRSILLFDWPFHSRACFRVQGGLPNLAEVVFGKSKKCFFATELESDVIESYWTVADNETPGGFQICTFKSGLPVKNEYFLASNKLDLKLVPNREDGKCVVVVETKWREMANQKVPLVVRSKLFDNPWKNENYVTMETRIELFDDKSMEYQSVDALFNAKRDSWQKR